MSNLPEVSTNFDKFIKEGVVVVDFWAPWCGPCKMLGPIFDEVASKLPTAKFGKVNVDDAHELARSYQVRSIPNVCIFKDGQLVDRIVGLCDEDELASTIQKYL